MACLSDFINKLNNVTENEVIVGKCYSMCPQEEAEMRTRESMVHILEKDNGTLKLVKAYSRSAADSNIAVPHLLRPYYVLRDTVQYLLFEVSTRPKVPTLVIYNFIDDRLRAVRQDMTIQRLVASECVKLLEPMVRFYVYYGHRLCEYELKDYDPVLNKKQLLECLKLFLSYVTSLEKEDQNELENLTSFMGQIHINTCEKLTCDRLLMESLYIMCNLDDSSPLYRYLDLPEKYKSKPLLKLAYNIAVANMQGNFVRVSKLSKKLCPLTYYAFNLYIPTLQKKSLSVLSSGYSSKQLTVPSSLIRDWLIFNSHSEFVDTCQHYGLRVEGNKVNFNKGDFKKDAPVCVPKKNYVNGKVYEMPIKTIFMYKTEQVL